MSSNCKNCGIEIIQKQGQKPKKYCSEQCRFAYLYANRDEYACTAERISECEYCGLEFDNWNNTTRKYCCHAHYVEARYYRKQTVNESDEMTRTDKLTRVFQKRCDGLSFGKIADELGMSINTVKIWMHRYGNGNMAEEKSIKKNQFAQDSEFENAPIEICELPATAMRRIFLMCNASKFKGKYDHFASQVPQMMESNLQAGDIFVFCNKSRYQLSVLQWQGDGFVLMFRRTEQERYPWPVFFTPKAVEITRSDLEMLIEYPRFMRRIRGLATPEFLG